MNLSEIKHKINLVAAIAAVGALIAFIGTVSAFTEFSGQIGWLDLIVFGLLVICGIQNMRPTIDKRTAILNVVVGVFAIVITAFNYMRIADFVDAKSFMDVGIGIWLSFFGTILYTIFSISDLLFKIKK
jgi:hypothetical protein